MGVNLLSASPPSTIAVGVASAQFAAMVDGQQYELCSTTAAWILIGANPTAVAHTGIYVPANVPLRIACSGANVKVAIIQDATGGFASLTQLAA